MVQNKLRSSPEGGGSVLIRCLPRRRSLFLIFAAQLRLVYLQAKKAETRQTFFLREIQVCRSYLLTIAYHLIHSIVNFFPGCYVAIVPVWICSMMRTS